MLTRIQVDNFRCLVNLDLPLDRLTLLLGGNGSGKTTVFAVLRRLQGFIGGALTVDAAFPSADLTRWQQLDTQQFTMEVTEGTDAYTYSLTVEHDGDRRRRRIKYESLRMNSHPLFEFELGTARLYHDDFTRGPEYPFDWTRSGIGLLQARPDNRFLIRFRSLVGKMIIAGLYPGGMGCESKEEAGLLSWTGANFASWYRFLSQEHQGNILDLTQELRQVLPDFDSFSLREAGENARVLKVFFRSGAENKKPLSYNFDELSDGQRQIIVLYCLLYAVKGEGYSLFLDEPDNYVALREVQPWLTALQDACGEEISQAVLVSHHPEIIDYLAASAGRWFERPDNGPVRVSSQAPEAIAGLKVSEAVARGWTQ